jgi:hypothetical protein
MKRNIGGFAMTSYEEWLKNVDTQCWRRGGLSLSDLPDMDYRFMFEHRITPKSAACRALRNAGE